MTIADSLATRLREAVAEDASELLELCADLVAAPSPQPNGNTTAPAEVIVDWLTRRGLTVETVKLRPEKPNILATCTGEAGPGPHLVFLGHLDTLPDGPDAAWSVPRYRMGRTDGVLTGLGIGNMKAAVASLTVAYAHLARLRGMWGGRLTLALVADEVVFGPDGAMHLLATRDDLVADAVLCGEGPGGMTLGLAEKGLLWLELTSTADAGQGMLATRGSTATARLARLLTEMDAWNEEQIEPPMAIRCVASEAGAHRLRLSVNAGQIAGGGIPSQIAEKVRATVDLRLPPGLTADSLEARVVEAAKRVGGITVRRLKGWNPNWTAPDAAIVRAVADAALVVRGSRPAPVVRLPGSDAARWRALGVPALCYGPQAELASGPDDYVLEADLQDSAAVYALAAASFLNGS
jgi:succinyl-diaminopimelate desuccinylase